jgi:hypothetical protein
MARCRNCLNEIEQDDLFCIHCGQSINKGSPSDSSIELDSSNQFADKEHSKMPKWEYIHFSWSGTGFMGFGKGAYVTKPDGETIKVGDASYSNAIKALNKMGDLGWEVVNFAVHRSDIREFLLKREKNIDLL